MPQTEAPIGRADTMPAEGLLRNEPMAGDKIGRYAVISKLGAGGMGLVYLAHDPSLDRKVALKLVNPDHSDLEPAMARARFLREAKLMAKLSHPNVLTVLEVGTFLDRVFIAMEFVEGQTLRAWQQGRKRTWREVVDVFIQAGQGLEAAHASELIHRDFKPENVMIDKDGRTRVLDFGMAALSATTHSPDLAEASELATGGPELDPSMPPLTQTGAIMGTPGYIPPEQYLETPVDARSDQFSFCVSLYESLYEARPFQGSNQFELAARVTKGQIEERPSESDVPRWLEQLALKGLSTNPKNRFESMTQLLEQLRPRDEDKAAKRGIILAISVVVVGIAIVVSTGLLGRQDETSKQVGLCQSSADKLAGPWGTESQASIREAFADLKEPFAMSSWEQAETVVDRYANDWIKMHTESCEATHLHGEQSEQLLDLRTLCLESRRQEFSELMKLFKRPDLKIAQRAAQAAHALTPVDDCSSAIALSSEVAPPASNQDRPTANLRADLARAKVLGDAGKYQEGLVVTDQVEIELKSLGYKPVHAEWLFLRGLLLRGAGQSAAAAESLRAASRIAQSTRDERLKLRTWIELVVITGYELSDSKEALVWANLAEGALDSGRGDDQLRAKLYLHMGATYFRAVDFEQSIHYNEKSLAIRQRILPAEHPARATSLDYLGTAYLMNGDAELGLQHLQQAHDMRVAGFGAEHPLVAESCNNLGSAYFHLGNFEESIAQYNHAVERWKNALGERHPDVATALTNLATVHVANEDYELALELYEHALSIEREALGNDHINVSITQHSMGAAQALMGEDERALSAFGEAVKTMERAKLVEHPHMATALHSYGVTAAQQEHFDEALSALERSIRVKTLADLPPAEIAVTRFELAQVVLEFRNDHKRAMELAQSAERDLESPAGSHEQQLSEVTDWIDQHRK